MLYLILGIFWTLVTDYLPQLKDEIMARDGTLVIRPDSGDPVKILTGYKNSPVSEYSELFQTQDEAEKDVLEKGYEAYRWNGEYYGFENSGCDNNGFDSVQAIQLMPCEVKGLIECLWDTFGGTTSSKGFKILDEHIGAIYGDAITLKRQRPDFTTLNG